MRIKRALSLAGFSLWLVSAILQLGGCSSTPQPAEADGRSRVPANDASRVQALQQRVHADRQLLSDNGLLRAQVDALQTKLHEMTSIVREALLVPPAPRPSPASMPVLVPVPAAPSPAASSLPMAARSLPAYDYVADATGAVIRVFYAVAGTEFASSEQVAFALSASVQGAERIEVRGYTDSDVATAADQRIAQARAEKARRWLIQNGVEASRISTKSFAAGHFLADNSTVEGRSKNRRVDIDIHAQRLAGNSGTSGN
jgi:hypothetical protein